jgi:hypothetical protein
VKPGETVLAMSLPHGGHLTHGTKVSFSGKWFDAVHYGVDKDTEDIDYDQVEAWPSEHRPKMIICGGSAIPRLIDFARSGRSPTRSARSSWSTRRTSSGWSPARRSRARCPTPTSSLHDPQGAARAAREA